MRERRILVIDDDDVYRRRLVRAFQERGLRAQGAASGEEASVVIADATPTDAVVDLRLAGESGLDVISALRAVSQDTAIVMLTGYGSIATAVEATKRGAVHYLQKPADADEILRALSGQHDVGAGEASAPSLDRVEWEHLQRVLTDCEGNVSEAARRLGVHRRTLQRKLQRLPPRR